MRQILKRANSSVKHFWSRVSVQRLTAALLLLALISYGAWQWYHAPRIAEVKYDQCEISYGEVVDGWSGTGDEPWNEKGTYYQARRFMIKAEAPNAFFPNIIEREPTRVATGGEYACLKDFDERIDLSSADYRYQGARAEALRFGAPAEKDAQARHWLSANYPAEAKAALQVPVASGPAAGASVWVDDGGSAIIIDDGEEAVLWCVNDEPCGDIANLTDQSVPMRGNGYLYVHETCNEAPGCLQWQEEEGQLDYGIDELGGMHYGFDLRLHAVSTYAPVVGAEMILIFAYPEEVEAELVLESETGTRYEPGDEIELTATLQKRGPSIETVELTIDTDNQPLEASANSLRLEADQLAQLNYEESLEVPLRFALTESAARDRCHTLTVRSDLYETETALQTASSFEYCIEPEASSGPISQRSFSYQVATRGNTSSSLTEFAAASAQTLRDSRGWIRAGVSFTRVESGGDFTLWLATPEEVAAFSSGCSAVYSCRVGTNVIINEDRWLQATPSWNNAGGSLRDYRHMVINHEVGHFLGHGHYNCPSTGSPAPVMQQQSIDLQGCEFNPWPLPFEIAALSP